MKRKIYYNMQNEHLKLKGNITLNDYKYILQHSTHIQLIGKDIQCTYNGFQCKFIFQEEQQ